MVSEWLTLVQFKAVLKICSLLYNNKSVKIANVRFRTYHKVNKTCILKKASIICCIKAACITLQDIFAYDTQSAIMLSIVFKIKQIVACRKFAKHLIS